MRVLREFVRGDVRRLVGSVLMEELAYDSELRLRGDGTTAAYLDPPGVENHASFLTLLADGTLVAAWFSGAREARPDACIYVARLPRGATAWEPAVKVSDDPERSEQNPALAELPDGRLWVLYTAQEFGSQDTALLKQQFSTDGGRTWSAPERFGDTVGLFTRSPLIQQTATRWLLPVFYCPALPGRVWHGDGDYTAVLITEDAGASWREVEVPASVGAVHMCVVPLDRHVSGSQERLPLTIQASRDRGLTWTEVYVLEDEDSIHPSLAVTPGRKKREFSYPAIVSDGETVDVTYSYARRTIKHARLPVSALVRA